MTFYIVIAVISVTTFTADMILRYMEKIKSFGMETRFHNIKGSTIPIEDFIPHNFTMAAVFFLTFGVVGILLKLLDMNGLVSFPIALLSGALMNFLIMHFIYPRVVLRPIPAKADLSECDAVCSESMDAEHFGSVRVTWRNAEYTFPAFPANENLIQKGDKVVVLYREDGVCFIEKTDRIMDILNEEP